MTLDWVEMGPVSKSISGLKVGGNCRMKESIGWREREGSYN